MEEDSIANPNPRGKLYGYQYQVFRAPLSIESEDQFTELFESMIIRLKGLLIYYKKSDTEIICYIYMRRNTTLTPLQWMKKVKQSLDIKFGYNKEDYDRRYLKCVFEYDIPLSFDDINTFHKTVEEVLYKEDLLSKDNHFIYPEIFGKYAW